MKFHLKKYCLIIIAINILKLSKFEHCFNCCTSIEWSRSKGKLEAHIVVRVMFLNIHHIHQKITLLTERVEHKYCNDVIHDENVPFKTQANTWHRQSIEYCISLAHFNVSH